MKKTSLESFADRLMKLLPKLVQELWRRERNYLTGGLISLPQMRVLEHLFEAGPSQMQELAGSVGLRVSSMTGLIDRMVKHGLVLRARRDKDRRIVLVTLSVQGRKIFREIHVQKRRGILRLFSRLDERDRADYLAIIEKLVSAMSVQASRTGRRR